MRNLLSNRKWACLQVGSVLFLFTATALLSGCEPLRKKFTRKKKKDQQEEKFVPVLDPIEYPDKTVTPSEIYRHHFSLWQVWHKEIMTAMHEEVSDKKIVYLLNQLLLQLEEMQRVVQPEKGKKLNEYAKSLAKIKDQYSSPSPFRNTDGMQKRIEKIGKEMRLNFRLDDVQEHLSLGATQVR